MNNVFDNIQMRDPDYGRRRGGLMNRDEYLKYVRNKNEQNEQQRFEDRYYERRNNFWS